MQLTIAVWRTSAAATSHDHDNLALTYLKLKLKFPHEIPSGTLGRSLTLRQIVHAKYMHTHHHDNEDPGSQSRCLGATVAALMSRTITSDDTCGMSRNIVRYACQPDLQFLKPEGTCNLLGDCTDEQVLLHRTIVASMSGSLSWLQVCFVASNLSSPIQAPVAYRITRKPQGRTWRPLPAPGSAPSFSRGTALSVT